MKEIHIRDLMTGRKLEDLSPNELRAKIITSGGDPSDCRTKEELVRLFIKLTKE